MVPSQFHSRGRVFLLFPGALGDFLCFAATLPGLRRRAAAVTVVARPDWSRLLDRDDFDSASIDDGAIAEIYGSASLERARALFSDAAEIHSFTGAGDENFAARLRSLAPHVEVHPFRGFRAAEHASTYYGRCLGVAPEQAPLAIAEEHRSWARARLGSAPALVLHAGSGSPRKNWDGFAELTREWVGAGGRVIELRGPAERSSPLLAGAEGLDDELPRVAALLREASLYLGNDSGITHLAAALGSSGIALFGTGDPSHWRPRSSSIRLLQAASTCDRCETLCRHQLSVQRVLEALRAVTSDNRGSRTSSGR